MTAEFEFQNYINPCSQGVGHANQPTGTIDMMLKRDRFELLSAYLDGEVTAAERRQVEDWLANDPEVQSLYSRLLKLRHSVRTLPVPPQPVERTIQGVYARLNRRRQIAVVGGGTAIAALLVGSLSGLLLGRQSITPQLVQVPEPVVATAEPLMVALNTPVVEIPKAPIASPEKAVKQTQSRPQPTDQNGEVD